MVVGSSNGLPVAVNYPPPSPQGGTAPVATACTPASGTPFPVGDSTVTCTASDARQQTATCTFQVRVQAQLQRTRIVAFGDSVTWGEGGPLPVTPAWRPLVRVDRPYPSLLEEALDRQYPFQAGDIVVLNEGVSGEVTADGLKRLPGVLKADQAQVVLILEGANDLNQTGEASVTKAANNLEEMVKLSVRSGVATYLATLPPQNPNGPKGQNASLVPKLNEAIVQVAANKGAVLVDINAAFGGDLTLISADGLHPNQLGYQRMADTFFEVLRRTLEVAPEAPQPGPSGVSSWSRRWPDGQ
jgi:acyl-CoA thioesterase-1